VPLRRTQGLLALTFVTGVVDATTFLFLGGVFSAMMTGNVIFLGFGISTDRLDAPVLAPLLAIVAYLAGGLGAALLIGRARTPHPLLRRGVVIEVAVLTVAAVCAAVVEIEPGEVSGYVLLGSLAAVMAMRTTLVRNLGSVDVPTTVLNLTLSAVAAGTPGGLAGPEHLRLRAASLAALLVGAFAGGLALNHDLWAPLALAAACTAVAGALILSAEAGRDPDARG
jgi:uncharacterized membrane protein YoaK (UPF0700 family)